MNLLMKSLGMWKNQNILLYLMQVLYITNEISLKWLIDLQIKTCFIYFSGYFYVHQQCASWCSGVESKEDGSFRNLETELVRSLNQRCQHCGNFGAGLACRVHGCDVVLHFPCAALSGAFQNSTSRSVACFMHLESSQSLRELSIKRLNVLSVLS